MDKKQDKMDRPIPGGSLGDDLTCEEYCEEIPLVIGGDLELEVLDLLVAHLAVCEPCADRTALAAQARAALHAGLDGETQAWREPQLWPQVAPLLEQGNENQERIEVAAGSAPLAPILRFSKLASKVVLPVAAAIALFVMLKTDRSGNIQPGSDQPNRSGREEQLVQQAPGAADWFTGAREPQLAAADGTYDPKQEFAALAGGVPPGLLEPLSQEDQRELERASRLRVDLDAERSLLRIRQGSGAVLTSLPYSH